MSETTVYPHICEECGSDTNHYYAGKWICPSCLGKRWAKDTLANVRGEKEMKPIKEYTDEELLHILRFGVVNPDAIQAELLRRLKAGAQAIRERDELEAKLILDECLAASYEGQE